MDGTTWTYVVIDGLAIAEGDIILGTAEEIMAMPSEPPPTRSIITNGRTWPDGLIPYMVSPELSGVQNENIRRAIEHWERFTDIRFKKLSWKELDAIDFLSGVGYVQFKPGDWCRSQIGFKGRPQWITLNGVCGLGGIIHEIGHTVGLKHEQSRCDRDEYVFVNEEAIIEGKLANFRKHCDGYSDVGSYNYRSIMHYHRYAWITKTAEILGWYSLITLRPGGDEIGQGFGLSIGDVVGVQSRYASDTLTSEGGNGRIYQYTDEPCATAASCVGWQLLDNDRSNGRIAVAGGDLYKLRTDGTIYKHNGQGCSSSDCSAAWEQIYFRNDGVGIWAAAYGKLYVMNENHSIYQYNPTNRCFGRCGLLDLGANHAGGAIDGAKRGRCGDCRLETSRDCLTTAPSR